LDVIEADGFTGKVVIVTGGSSGIGACVARALAARGAKVAVLASSNIAKALPVVQEIESKGGNARCYALDVRDDEAVRALVASVEQDLGPVEILVNAAGIFLPSPPGETDPAVVHDMIDINIKGTWNCIQAVVPTMKKHGGRILNFSSVAGTIGVKGFALYCASKAAIVMMTRVLASELAASGIRINAIAPGNTETPMNGALRSDPAMKDALEAMNRMTPSGTTFSQAEDIAAIAVFLLSNAARPIHGATLVADEGISAAIG
jgi:3-oxoacyl-[acyl-carrier protein] reductase